MINKCKFMIYKYLYFINLFEILYDKKKSEMPLTLFYIRLNIRNNKNVLFLFRS